MATTSPIRGSRRGNARLVAAAVGFCALIAALFMLVQAPSGTAASQARLVITTSDGVRHAIRAGDVRDNASITGGTITVNDGNTSTDVPIPHGVTLDELLGIKATPP